MKTKTLLAMTLAAAIGTFAHQTTLAQEQKEHGEHKQSDEQVKVPGTLDGIWAEIHKHHKELADTVSAKKLADVHHHAFAIRDLGKALPAKVPAEHRKHIENMVKKLSQLAAALDKSGDAGDQATTEANLKKLDGLLKEMEDMAGPSESAPHKH